MPNRLRKSPIKLTIYSYRVKWVDWQHEEKQPWQTLMERKLEKGLVHVTTSRKCTADQEHTSERVGSERSKAREVDKLAAAILRLLDWQSRQLQLKADRRIKAMITRQLRLRQNRERSLPD